jgi:hypothetical protein
MAHRSAPATVSSALTRETRTRLFGGRTQRSVATSPAWEAFPSSSLVTPQLGCSRRGPYTLSMTDMTTIKVSVQTRDRLKRLADEDHLTMDGELARTLDQAEGARFWEGVRADYARLQADPQEWADYVNELAEWDHAVGDGLDDE